MVFAFIFESSNKTCRKDNPLDGCKPRQWRRVFPPRPGASHYNGDAMGAGGDAALWLAVGAGCPASGFLAMPRNKFFHISRLRPDFSSPARRRRFPSEF
jgi:hypothetical protein